MVRAKITKFVFLASFMVYYLFPKNGDQIQKIFG